MCLCLVIITSDKGERNFFAHVCNFVCLFVCQQDYSKTRAWVWMKCCMSTLVGTWTNCLTFEPNPDYIPDAGTGLLSPISYKHCYAEFYVGKIPHIHIGGPPLQQGMVLKWFYYCATRMHSTDSVVARCLSLCLSVRPSVTCRYCV